MSDEQVFINELLVKRNKLLLEKIKIELRKRNCCDTESSLKQCAKHHIANLDTSNQTNQTNLEILKVVILADKYDKLWSLLNQRITQINDEISTIDKQLSSWNYSSPEIDEIDREIKEQMRINNGGKDIDF